MWTYEPSTVSTAQEDGQVSRRHEVIAVEVLLIAVSSALEIIYSEGNLR